MILDHTPTSFHFVAAFISPIFGPDALDTSFQSITGLEVSLETENFKEGGENRFSHALPGRSTHPNLVLKRGLMLYSPVVEWCMKTFNDQIIIPVNLVVSLLNPSHTPVMTWNVVNAYPVKWSVSEFNAEQSGLAIETLELNYQRFTMIKGVPI